MATYKVIQNIEAEDKLVGPLSLRQFVYAGIAAFMVYLSVLSIMKGASFLVVLFVPPILFCLFFAWPWTPDQPTEVWALARIRFYFKPRKRIWDQTGMKELVTITAPKRVEKFYTNGLSQDQVKSRLAALADTIDSRGWVIKNANASMARPGFHPTGTSDRLIDFSSIPQEVTAVDVQASDDILDELNNPIAHQFDQMIDASTQARRQQIVNQLNQPAGSSSPQQPADYWFLHQPAPAASTAGLVTDDPVVFANPQVIQPGYTNPGVGPVAATPTPDEEALAHQLRQQETMGRASYAHLKHIQPLTPGQPAPAAATQPGTTPGYAANVPAPTAVPSQPDAAILNLANNNDLNVATLAREAQKARSPEELSDNEVVVSLH